MTETVSKRQKIRIFVASLKRYDVASGCTLPHFLAQIEEIVCSIPVDDRENVRVDWTDGDECDSGYIEFRHYRDETDEEMAAREVRESAQVVATARKREAQERAALAALKEKYEK